MKKENKNRKVVVIKKEVIIKKEVNIVHNKEKLINKSFVFGMFINTIVGILLEVLF